MNDLKTQETQSSKTKTSHAQSPIRKYTQWTMRGSLNESLECGTDIMRKIRPV